VFYCEWNSARLAGWGVITTPDRQPCQHLITQFFTGRMPLLTPNQQCQSTAGKTVRATTTKRISGYWRSQVGLCSHGGPRIADAEQAARRGARREPVAGRKALHQRDEVRLEIRGRMNRGNRSQRFHRLVANDGLLNGGETFQRCLSPKYTRLPPPHHNRFTALFPGPPRWAGARRELLDFIIKIKRQTHQPSGWAPLHPD